MMISYIINGEGFLITNREIISEEIEDFEYTPNEEFETEITVYNEPNEKGCLSRFVKHIQEAKPFIITSFNGDFFDWPFLEARMQVHGINMTREIGITNNSGEYFGRFVIHLDCFPWVKRDSYLPQGSHGLKSVAKKKLYYDPIEIDPELMLPFARERPKVLCNYSVSDAVATYYLYKKHIHDFIFALCTIIPLGPDDVLRRGSGTLCELLLMAEAFTRGIIFPNKKSRDEESFYNGHLIDSETYIGGKVECLHNGVYRSDFETDFQIDTKTYQRLIEEVPQIIKFWAEIEQGKSVEDISNIDELKGKIIEKLSAFAYLDNHKFNSLPLIYHVDVAAMYPNIILTNRLQPVAIVNEKICSSCVYNTPESNCKRDLEWMWKAEYFPINRGEYESIKLQFDKTYSQKHNDREYFPELKKKIKTYSRKMYKTTVTKIEELRKDTVCMRENPFYVNTVRSFRDRRYEFKEKVKIWSNKHKGYNSDGDVDQAKSAWNLMLLYDSLQLAHKIILNSFYGYVMRKGARWYSMEMAAMVTHTGANIISITRDLLLGVGKPLELDTDGVWTLLPQGFPENFEVKFNSGKKETMSYFLTICNYNIYDKFKNPQYQSARTDKKYSFNTKTEMTIFFELDGPYRAMVIPASTEEGKKLKKRYAIFDMKGKLCEVKGFEIKRRGELKIIKIFQQEIFEQFLKGSSLKECYAACADTANKWLGILINKGGEMSEDEIVELIGESKFLSKNIKDYGEQKGVAITAAKRMQEFLGEGIAAGTGLNCKFIISKNPSNAPVNQRAIPISIFKLKEKSIKMKFLRKWLDDQRLEEANLNEILDWDYYTERLGKQIQKMITIIAAFQGIDNPVPLIKHPQWLARKLTEEKGGKAQTKMEMYFKALDVGAKAAKQMEALIPQQLVPSIRTPASSGKNSSALKHAKFQDLPKCTQTINQNFGGWLTEQKALWKFKRDRKKAGIYTKTTLSSRRDIDVFLKSANTFLAQNIWNIIGLQRTSIDGIYNCWVIVSGMYLPIKVQLNRTIYIHSTRTLNIPNFKLTKKILPRDKVSVYLYEFKCVESQFHKRYAEIQKLMSNAFIEGIYESKIPLEFKFASKIGNFCRLKNGAESKDGVWNGDDLEEINSYQEDIRKYVDAVYVGIFSYGSNNLLLVINEKLQTLDLIILHKTNKPQEPYLKFLKASSLNSKLSNFSNFKINIRQKKTIDEPLMEVFQGFKNISKDNFIVCVQGENRMAKQIQGLVDQYLCMSLGDLKTEDSEQHLQNITVFNWIIQGAEILITNYLELESTFLERSEISREINCPMASISSDWITYSTDILYSRILEQNNMVSWASKDGQPDTGIGRIGIMGGEEIRDLYEMQVKREPVIFTPNIIVEIKLRNFEINTILSHDSMMKEDGRYSRLLTANTNKYDKSAEESTTKAFLMVYRLILKLLKQMGQNQDLKIAAVIENIVNWIADRKSTFYDQEMLKLLRKLIDKSFSRLLDEFRLHGAKIVDASPARILVDTQKKTLGAAGSYTEFLLGAIRNKSVFNFIDFSDQIYWKSLIIKDEKNFAGLLAQEDQIDLIRIVWKEAEILPDAMKKKMYYYVEKFLRYNVDALSVIFANKQDLNAQNEVAMLEVKTELETRIKNFFKENMIMSILEFLKYSKENLWQISHLKESLKDDKLIEEELKKVDEKSDSAEGEFEEQEYDSQDSFIEKEDGGYLFDQDDDHEARRVHTQLLDHGNHNELKEFMKKQLIGQKDKNSDPLIDFTDIMIDVFNSIPFMKEEVYILSKMSSGITGKQLGIVIHGADPLIKINLVGIACNECAKISTLDLFREFDSSTYRWYCPCCSEPYDNILIEIQIINWLNLHFSSFYSQNFYCKSSNLARIDYLTTVSDAGGKFELKNDLETMVHFQTEAGQGFRNLFELARVTKMYQLQSVLLSLKV